MKRTLLVTGASGYLGRHLTARAVKNFNLYAAYNRQADQIKAGQSIRLNLAERVGVLKTVADLKPAAIIHAAAVNPGSGSGAEMWQTNVEGSRNVAEAAVAAGARLVHVSSDLVFDGCQAPYADQAAPAPLDDYGRSKAAAETAVAEIDPQAAIVRTSLIYGLEDMDRGTAGFVERLQRGEPLLLFNDVLRQPVWVETLVAALLKLVDLDFSGPLNVAGRQLLTREAFGRKMLAWWQVEAADLISAGRAADISGTIPLDLRLSVARAEQLLQMTLPGVDAVLAQARA